MAVGVGRLLVQTAVVGLDSQYWIAVDAEIAAILQTVDDVVQMAESLQADWTDLDRVHLR